MTRPTPRRIMEIGMSFMTAKVVPTAVDLRLFTELAREPGDLAGLQARLIDDNRRKNSFGLVVSLNMLIETAAGFNYTGADCMAWTKEAGFRKTHVEHLVGPDSMVVANK